MPQHRVIVLKFGGSVLRSEADLAIVAHEVYRWVRRGRRVVAVVSALAGETNRLLAQSDAAGADCDHHATAALAATGERASAALLALTLDRVGVPCECLDEAALSLRTQGPPLDASPHSFDTDTLLAALERAPVVVAPGFTGRDEHGRVTTFGRGGSDLTALFIAQRLGAACRLVKDVDGLYEWDPAAAGPTPRRHQTITCADALRLDGSIVQHKAVRFAQSHGTTFEVGALHRDDATTVGAERSALAQRCAGALPPLRILLAGVGIVGGGVFEALRALPDQFEITGALVRDRNRAAAALPSAPDGFFLTTDQLPAAEFDVLVEAIGGEEPAATIIADALSRGRDVVTANKAAIAAHGPRLEALAESHGAALRWSAAAGGAAPILEAARRHREHGDRIVRVEAILNGTANYVLDRVAQGATLADALDVARRRGFAERDASRDLDGRDAADKLALLHHALTGTWPDPHITARDAINENTASSGRRHVALLSFESDAPELSVRPASLPADHPLASVRDEWNGAVFHLADGERSFVRGRGAGRWPTTQAVVADLLDLWRSRAGAAPSKCTYGKEHAHALV